MTVHPVEIDAQRVDHGVPRHGDGLLRDGLAEIRMAFVQIHNAERARDASQGS